MSASEAVLGYQTFIYRENTLVSPPQMVKIGEIINFGAFGSKRGLAEVTHMDSPNSTKEFILTLKDGAEFNITCNFTDDPAQSGLRDDHDSAVRRNFEVEYAGSLGNDAFTALVLSWETSPDPNAPLQRTFGLKITSDIELT